MISRELADPAATEALGAVLGGAIHPGLRIYLQGELGAGKTTLVRGLLRTLGHAGPVKSPSFSLVESYSLPAGPVYHLDLYRMADARELESIGYRDYFDRDSLCLVEWPERAAGRLEVPDLLVRLEFSGSGRRADLEPSSPAGEDLLASVRDRFPVSPG